MVDNDFRTIDGTDNNGDLGAANTQLIRLFEPDFEDGISVPRGGPFDESTLPNPRTISNIVVDQTEFVTNFLNASDWLWQWGQVLDHDFALNEDNEEQDPRGEFTPIPLPQDPSDSLVQNGNTELPFTRVPRAEGTGETTPRQINNQLTAFIDGSLVYGSDEERAVFLRDTESGQGLLKTTIGDNGEVLLPLNPIDPETGEVEFPNALGGVLGDFQFLAGDIRVNEQIGLNAAHNLLVREHNRIALELDERLEAGEEALVSKFEDFQAETDLSGEEALDEFLYENARRVIGAQIQVISYNEFLPLLIGEDTIAEYEGFNPDINPQVSVEFANAAFRLGHTLLSDQLRRVDGDGITETELADAFFNPEDIQENGIDSLLTGLIFQGAQEVDNQIVDGVREFLFPAGQGGLDLGAVNIARAREVGIPGYTEVYEEIFGVEITSFDDLRSLGLFSSPVLNLLETAYETVDQIDLWIGGIAELPADHGGLLGPTLSFFIADQFTRVRDGDEFFYLNDLEHLSILAPDIEDTTLSDLIRNNVANPYLVPDNAFETPFENSVFGDNSNNILIGTSLDDLIDGQAGNDVIQGNGGEDFLFGGAGDDEISGNSANDRLFGGAGNDELLGGGGADTLVGDSGADILVGGGSADILIDGSGSDVLTGNDGNDTFALEGSVVDGVIDSDLITDFEIGDILDVSAFAGTVSLNFESSTFLQFEIDGEDLLNIVGTEEGIASINVNNIVL